jgi:GrpB-like predicted nucleotidyltransferase (UPF0157 family)
MSEDETKRNLRLVIVEAYRPDWSSEFTHIGRRIRGILGNTAIRIDHIGSTAVPGLSAKDVIDVQITVADLDAAERVTHPLRAAGFRQGETFETDVFHSLPAASRELRKLYMREPEGERRVHLHIRELGRFNQRFALLFRDYLRASDIVCAEYELLKRCAAQAFPENIDGYLRIKEPVFHIIYEAASLWADKTGWETGNDYL